MGNVNFRCIENPVIRKADEGEGRKMTFVASDGTRDSARTVLNPKGWVLKRFNSNGVVAYQHNVYGSVLGNDDPDYIIGKGRAYVEGNELLLDVEFEPEGMNQLADKVYKKLKFGTLNAVSVGFRPIGNGHFGTGDEAFGQENETYYFEGQELLEVSVVNIPANPNALKRSAELAEQEWEQHKKEALEIEAKKMNEKSSVCEVRKAELDRTIILAEAALHLS